MRVDAGRCGQMAAYKQLTGSVLASYWQLTGNLLVAYLHLIGNLLATYHQLTSSSLAESLLQLADGVLRHGLQPVQASRAQGQGAVQGRQCGTRQVGGKVLRMCLKSQGRTTEGGETQNLVLLNAATKPVPAHLDSIQSKTATRSPPPPWSARPARMASTPPPSCAATTRPRPHW